MSGPEDQDPWEREDEEIRKAFAAKDAEIARLKSEIEDWKENERRALSLITELCDALEAKTSCVEDDDIALVKRAREVTR